MPKTDRTYTELGERIINQLWAKSLWKQGTLLGDLARMDPKELTDDEALMLVSAYEGFLAAAKE